MVFLLVCPCSSGEGPMRVWTSPEGRTMKAAFLKFDGEKAVFKKQDGSSFSLSPSVFFPRRPSLLDEFEDQCRSRGFFRHRVC